MKNDDLGKIPSIRFKGFTNAWELRRLGDLLVERNIQVPENEEYPLMSFVQGLGVTPKGDRYDRSFLVTSSEKKYKVTEYGDFIYSSNNLETGSIGFNRTGKAVISPVYSIFYSKNNLESRYIGILSPRKDFIAKMTRYRQGVIYGQWRIHESDFLEIKILIPTEKEQKEIIQTFDTLDNLITLHQRKLDKTKELKKTMLSKMFPKNGEDKPELRFSGFTGAWEQCVVDEIANRFDNLRIPVSASERVKGNIPYYGANGIQDYVEGFTHEGGFVLVAEDGANDLKNYPVQYVNGKVWVNNHAHVLQSKGGISDNVFLMNSLKNINIEPFLVGGGRPKLNADVMMKISLLIPSLQEQTQIGIFFESLDNLITLHQRELEKLKNIKKTLLKHMFV